MAWREYTKADLDKAPLLALFGTRWIAKMAPREGFGRLQIVGNKHLVDPKPFGRIDPYVVRGMSSWLAEELKKREVKGFTVRDIEILRRKPEHQPIWEPWSTVTMPRCRLPLVTSWGELQGTWTRLSLRMRPLSARGNGVSALRGGGIG